MKRLRVILILFGLSFILSGLSLLNAQLLKIDSLGIERLAMVCKLWGHLKYFHPFLEEPASGWDQAFVDNLNDIMATSNSKEFADCVQSMLDYLNDPVTRLIFPESDPVVYQKNHFPEIKYITDSIIMFSVRNYADLENYGFSQKQFSILEESLPKLKGLIFDIRSDHALGELRGGLSIYLENIQEKLITKPIRLPQ